MTVYKQLYFVVGLNLGRCLFALDNGQSMELVVSEIRNYNGKTYYESADQSLFFICIF